MLRLVFIFLSSKPVFTAVYLLPPPVSLAARPRANKKRDFFLFVLFSRARERPRSRREIANECGAESCYIVEGNILMAIRRHDRGSYL